MPPTQAVFPITQPDSVSNNAPQLQPTFPITQPEDASSSAPTNLSPLQITIPEDVSKSVLKTLTISAKPPLEPVSVCVHNLNKHMLTIQPDSASKPVPSVLPAMARTSQTDV